MNLLIVLGLSFQCMLDSVSYASSIQIGRGWEFHQSRSASKKQLKKFLKELANDKSKKDSGIDKIDSRVLAISWIESRIRPRIRRGDKGKACGMFQIHARYSYPMFRRKRGFVGWKESEEKSLINRECSKLESIRYSVNTMNRLLVLMDKKGLHPCHHNSGFYGKCNTWYKQRLEYWITYFNFTKLMCNERLVKIMAMMKTGVPTPTAPASLIQGYLDAMGGKPPQSEDSVYNSGYNLAKLVQKGKAEAPAWAVSSEEGGREG